MSELTNWIKTTEPLMLQSCSCSCSSLELYWVQYPVPNEDEAYETLVESIHQNTIQFDPKNKLARPLQMLSSITGGFPKGNIHVLVKVPEGGESIDSVWALVMMLCVIADDVSPATTCNDSCPAPLSSTATMPSMTSLLLQVSLNIHNLWS